MTVNDILSGLTKKNNIDSTDKVLIVNTETQTVQYVEVQEIMECCDSCLPTPSDVSFIMI